MQTNAEETQIRIVVERGDMGTGGAQTLNIPWPSVTEHTATVTTAIASKMLRKVLLRYLPQQLGMITTAQHVNLIDCNRVQKALDHTKDSRKPPWRIDDVKFPQSLWIVVL